MDFLDILEGRYEKTHSGRYFVNKPQVTAFPSTVEEIFNLEEGQDFDYTVVDPTAWRYKQILTNLTDSEAADATIKTCEALDWKVKKHIALDNGRLMAIISITEDVSAASKEAARYMPIPIGTDYILRLVEVENPWGLV